ncbi:MAG: hypothetical protein KAU14_07605 [Thermoplasmata archaeon]|nr:hypothetical protein [Thermoplasmata archaeon]
MIEISSESVDIFEFIKQHPYRYITLDIETLDSKSSNSWNEPIISFSLSFVSEDYISSKILIDFPTFAFGITNVDEEYSLLVKLKEILTKIPRDTIIIGYNVSYELKCKKIEGWYNCQGYDIPKTLKRGNILDLNMSIIKEFNAYDTMQVAYDKLNHVEHGLKYEDRYFGKMKIKTMLSSVELEKIMNIQRPRNVPKLGPKVREYFNKGKYKEILLYNCSDTIVESIFFRLFEHKLRSSEHPDGLISFKKKCEHIPKSINVEDVESWARLMV